MTSILWKCLEDIRGIQSYSPLSVLQSVEMAGANIILLLTILLAPQAVPAYKLKYFNVKTNATVTISYPIGAKLASALRFVSDVSKFHITFNKFRHNLYLTHKSTL